MNNKRKSEEQLDLVEKHLKYWKEIEKTNVIDIERLNELKNKLKMEERVCNKIKDHIKHIDNEIKIQKEHIP